VHGCVPFNQMTVISCNLKRTGQKPMTGQGSVDGVAADATGKRSS
jgi:hypothetical protein